MVLLALALQMVTTIENGVRVHRPLHEIAPTVKEQPKEVPLIKPSFRPYKRRIAALPLTSR